MIPASSLVDPSPDQLAIALNPVVTNSIQGRPSRTLW